MDSETPREVNVTIWYFNCVNFLSRVCGRVCELHSTKRCSELDPREVLGKKGEHHFLCLSVQVRVPRSNLTFVFCLQFLCHQAVLSVTKHKRQKWEDQGIQNPNNGQDVCPADWTSPKSVLVCLFSTHPFYFLWIPAIRENHTTKHKAGSWERERKKKEKNGVNINFILADIADIAIACQVTV